MTARGDLLALLGLPRPTVARPLGVAAWLATLPPGPRDDAVRRALEAQVGPPWTGTGALGPERLRLVRAVAASVDGDAEALCAEGARHHHHGTGVVLHVMRACWAGRGRARLDRKDLPAADAVARALHASFGRSAVPPEAAGAVAHWTAERSAGGPLRAVDVGLALRGLREVAATWD